ncbi:RDD family protein [Halosimplex sp. TS25]|uniref:RDD family protein n=1 Tax=Halosimplex rarum TaxID=3396619 RepID=UPI0039EA0EE4
MRLTLRRPDPRIGTEDDVVASRVAAFAIDQLLVVGLLVTLGSFVLGVAGATLGAGVELGIVEAPLSSLTGGTGAEFAIAAAAAVFGVAWTATTIAYFTVTEGAIGASVGKLLLGLVVVGTDGSPIGYRTAFVRSVLRIVDSQPGLYVLGVGSMLISDRRQRVGDRVAGTVVVAADRPTSAPSESANGTPV